jgi:hypothetical protein
MPRRSKKTDNSQTHVQDLVMVCFVEDLEQAKDKEALLKSNDMPARVKQQQDESTGVKGYAVMVPEDCIDEAHVVVESQDAYDDFYDYAMDDEEDDDFGSDFFGDES